ncbi:alpha/beta hydrolase [Haloarchaeobius amylolyticus]|uniref:alpha/beta hydrolase n=1 Tax=Haloarchaeobius amylolyticus TaxID=1198296 RepID=UPI00226ECE04|nr:alpha/beta hydrolase [Haloarchaeobius amylolyticus]
MRATLRRYAPYAAVAVVVLLALAATGAYVYFDVLASDATEPMSAVEADHEVAVEQAHGGYVIRDPDAEAKTVGLVYYPGGRVAPGAYVEALAPLVAEHDVTVYVPKMPLNLAVLDQGKATAVIRSDESVETWYVGGHSLGGAMACRYAANNAQHVEGLLLAASYCDVSIADSDLAVLAVTGTEDGVLNRDRFASSRANLPANASLVSIEGMNHSQFGHYGGQSGDDPGTISTAEAHERFVSAVVEWLCAEGEAVGCARQAGGQLVAKA